MDHTYLKINNGSEGKIYYFRITITKEFKYFSRGIEYCDYFIEITYFNLYSHYSDEDFEKEFGGRFLCIDDSNNVRIYDNVHQEFLDLENAEDCLNIFYIYNDELKHYSTITNVLKEALYNIFIVKQNY